MKEMNSILCHNTMKFLELAGDRSPGQSCNVDHHTSPKKADKDILFPEQITNVNDKRCSMFLQTKRFTTIDEFKDHRVNNGARENSHDQQSALQRGRTVSRSTPSVEESPCHCFDKQNQDTV